MRKPMVCGEQWSYNIYRPDVVVHQKYPTDDRNLQNVNGFIFHKHRPVFNFCQAFCEHLSLADWIHLKPVIGAVAVIPRPETNLPVDVCGSLIFPR